MRRRSTPHGPNREKHTPFNRRGRKPAENNVSEKIPPAEVLTPAGIIERMEETLTEPLEHRGYELVRVLISGRHRFQIQVMIDRLDHKTVTMDDCVEAHECVRHWLNLGNFIAQDYVLELSSPGLDRPLVKPEHFQRFVDNKVIVRTKYPINEQKRFTGMLKCATNHVITLVLDTTQVDLTYDQIDQARLVP